MDLQIKKYRCRHCGHLIETRIPTPDLLSPSKGYWDFATQCPHCKKLLFVDVWPNGKIKAVKLGPEA